MADSKVPALALLLAVLFGGGIVGGLLGAMLMARPQEPPASQPAGPSSPATALDPELAHAIGELAAEVRDLRQTRGDPSARERKPAGETDGAPAQDPDRLVTALDRLSLALEQAQGRAAPGGIGITPLVLPPLGSKSGAVDALVGRDWEEISREYRFWTFQQVLDRFGRPDMIDDERWIYRSLGGESEAIFTFQFSQGYLMNIYD